MNKIKKKQVLQRRIIIIITTSGATTPMQYHQLSITRIGRIRRITTKGEGLTELIIMDMPTLKTDGLVVVSALQYLN